MKNRKITVSVVLLMCMTMVFVFTGCKQYNYDLSKYVTVGEYKGLEYDADDLKVSAKDVQTQIDSDLSNAATTKDSKSGTVKDGDTINIDYVGTIDGKTFDKGSAENQSLTIGSGSMIDGFEDGLIGKAVGSKVTLNLTFPKSYEQNKDLQGKDVQFVVTINSKQVSVTPKLTTKWVKNNTSYKTIAAYKKGVKADLVKKAKQSVASSLLSTLVSSSTVEKYPDKEIKLLKKTGIKYYKDYAEQYKMEYEDFIKQYMNTEVDDFETQLEEQAKSEVAQEMVAFYIARQENLEATSDDVEKYIDNVMKENNLTEKSFEDQVGMSTKKYARKYKNDIMVSITVQNVQDFLFENGKAK